MNRIAAALWLTPGFVVLGVLFVTPLGLILWASFSNPVIGLANYREIFVNQLYFRVLVNTAVSAAGTTLGCLLIGYPTAYAIYRLRGAWRAVLLGAILFAYSVGTIPRAFSWLVILGDRGVVNRFLMDSGLIGRAIPMLYNQTGVLVGMIHVMLPFMVLVLLSSMLRVSPKMVPAARTLGASPTVAFWKVFFPLTRPGILAGVMITGVYSLGFYVAPAVLGGSGQTSIVMAIRELALTQGIWGIASALSAIAVVLSLIGAWVYVRATGLADAHEAA